MYQIRNHEAADSTASVDGWVASSLLQKRRLYFFFRQFD